METLTKSIKSKVMKLNQYEWDPENDVIGYGAFAEVFRARDNNGHYAALKIYREAITKGSTGGAFQNKYTLEEEYKKGELLAHTNVIRYINLDYIIHIDSMQRIVSYPVLVMEYADAGNLSDWLKSSTPPKETEAIKIAREVLSGLGYLHEQSIIHRDLKPGNILFKKDRMGNKVAKISDFGISRDTLQDSTNRPSATAGVGTIDYMAPEQLLKKAYGLNGEVSNRTDLWAGGVMLYRMLTGKMPFGEENKDYENIHSEIISKEPDYSKVPAKYQGVIKACLQKHASARPADANAVLRMLDDAPKKSSDNTIIPDDNQRTQINPDPFKDKQQQQQKDKAFALPPPKPKPVGKYIAIAAAVLLVIFLGVKFLHGGTDNVTNMQLRDSRGVDYTYTGTVRNNVPDGTGTATYPNKDSYTGNWKNGDPDNGTINYANGAKYVGHRKDFYFEGEGTYYYANGDRYEGNWSRGKKDGTGKFTFSNGETYQGDWRNDARNGNGTEIFPTGEKYVGPFSNDKYEGKGTLSYQNGDQYVGDFSNGLRTGKGVKYFNADNEYKGDKYEGGFTNGQFSGQGTYYWHNGDTYDGNWVNDKRSGEGIYTHAGTKYKEMWLYGTRISSNAM